MKKRQFLAMMAMMAVMMLSGCGANSYDSPEADAMEVTEASEQVEEEVDKEALMAVCLEQVEYGDILGAAWEGEPLAPSVIMDDYMSGRQEYANRYYTIEDDGYIRATVYLGDGHVVGRNYYPGAVARDDDWEAEDLIEGYLEQTLPWVKSKSQQMSYLFSRDYRHQFEVYDDWLIVDDIKVCRIGYETVGMEPFEVLYAYQNGWWDGTTPIFSCDYGTTAGIDHADGTLKYRYEEISYTEDYDPLQLVYKPYFDPPLCITTGVDSSYNVRYRDGYDFDYDNCSGKVFEAEVEVYVDLPGGTLDGFEDRISHQYMGLQDGMFIVMPDRIEQYRRGALMNTWECEVITEHPHIERYKNDNNFGDEIHVWISDEEIVRLLPNGKTETVLAGLTGDVYGIGEYSLMELSLVDGKLTGYSDMCGIVEIADDVESVDYAWNVALFTGKDGLRYMFDEDDYMATERAARDAYKSGRPSGSVIEVHCLGEKSWEDYLDAYRAGLIWELADSDGNQLVVQDNSPEQ